MFFGHAGDEVEVGFIELVHARHPGVDRARRLPAIAGGHVADDLRQADVLPTAAAGGLATAAHVAGLAADHQRVRWTGNRDLVHGVTAHARQVGAGIPQIDLDACATRRQRYRPIAVIDA
ncbi:hypothetical protein D3C84_921800 [compost metagenome]